MKKLNYLLLAFSGLLLCGCPPHEGVNQDTPHDGLHKGTFTNRNQQQANDLHIIFDKEGVRYDGSESKTKMASHDPVSKDGKTEIDMDGDININSSAFSQVFKRKDGDFKVEKYWWTIKEGDKSIKLGEDHNGPPSNDDGSGDWK